MSSVINNSNANSAIVQTIEASESLRNPNVYSTQEIFPPHSMTYSKCESSNGSVASGGSLNFNLNKYGIASQILLHIEKQHVVTATGAGVNMTLNKGDIFNIIKSVELLSSSRVISTLTSADFMSMFSNMDQAEFNVVENTAINVGTTQASTPFVFVLPLCFGQFKDINLQPNLSFVEPMSIRVNWGNVQNRSAPAAIDAANTLGLNASQTYLQVRYKAYPEDKVAQILDENYSQPELNQLSSRFYNENRVAFTGDGSAKDYDIDLKNTDAVKDFYIVVRKAYTNGGGVLDMSPVKINSVKFTGSGQEILNLTEHETPYLKLNAYGNAECVDLATGGFSLGHIVKIQTGVYHKSAMTNCFSLREINAPRITVNLSVTGAHTIDVVEDCLAIYSTSSATGRVNLSLSN